MLDPIEGSETCDEVVSTNYEKAVIDSVIKNLCCYSGKMFKGFTHAEAPWLKTRVDLPVTTASNRMIHKKIIGEYFKTVKEYCEMINPADIQIYSKKMLSDCISLPEKNKDYFLSGNWAGYRKYHIMPDWLLIYKLDKDVLVLTLTRTGSHRDLL